MLSQIPTTAIISSSLIILLTIFVYQHVIKPYKEFKLYERILTSSYVTLVCPYNILGTGTFSRNKQDLKDHNDSHYSIKTTYTQYQVVLSSFKGATYVDLIDPSLIKEFYDKNLEGCYKKYANTPIMMGLYEITGNGLLFSEGAEWKNKKIIMGSVFNFDFIKSKIKAISSIAEQKFKEVQDVGENKQSSSVRIDVNNLFQRIYGNVVIKCFFGDITLQKLQNQQIFSYFNSLLQKINLRSFSILAFLFPASTYKYHVRPIDRQVRHMILTFRQFAANIIKQQVQKIKQKDVSSKDKFIGVIQKLVKENQLKEQDQTNGNTDKKDYYTVKDLIDEFATFFVAGTETTSSMATVLIYLLAKHPEVQDKVRKQIDDVIGDNLSDLSFQNLKRLVYLDQVQKETLRMHSPTAGVFPRQVIKDHFIGNIPLKKGMLISLKMKANHHKEQFYRNPLNFNPDRWNNFDPSKVDAFSYSPFSAGLRNCIGQHLALLQSKVAIVMMLKRYKTIKPDKQEFRMIIRGLYSVEHMMTTFEKK